MSIVWGAHALVGSAVVSSGTMALWLSKGSPEHKLAGRFFVGSMLLMALVVGFAERFSASNISPLGMIFVCFILYLVLSAHSTVCRPEGLISPLDIAAPVVALCISISAVIIGLDAISKTVVGENDPPQAAYFFFAALAFLSMILDANNLRLGGVRGKHRIVRHVWRMSCALFFATSSLFTGPGSIVLPEPTRGNILWSIPQTLVLVIAVFWIVRLLFSKRRYSPKDVDTVQ